jgi:hypothetical protein
MPLLTPQVPNNNTIGSNNAIKDPFQGFDCTLWMLNARGQMVNRGFFTSVQFTFRNATEPYMELAQRVPRYLDGDFQIGWVAQRGMLDTGVLSETMGFRSVTREARISRSPRFNLVLYINAPELNERSPSSPSTSNDNNIYRSAQNNGDSYRRAAQGKIVLLNCKLDTFAMGIQAGQRVVANQWEGLSEGYQEVANQTPNSSDPNSTFATEEASINRTILSENNKSGDGNFKFIIPGATNNGGLSSFYKSNPR